MKVNGLVNTICAAGTRNAVFNAHIRCQRFLEFANLGTHDIGAMFEELCNALINGDADAFLLGFEINKGNSHWVLSLNSTIGYLNNKLREKRIEFKLFFRGSGGLDSRHFDKRRTFLFDFICIDWTHEDCDHLGYPWKS